MYEGTGWLCLFIETALELYLLTLLGMLNINGMWPSSSERPFAWLRLCTLWLLGPMEPLGLL